MPEVYVMMHDQRNLKTYILVRRTRFSNSMDIVSGKRLGEIVRSSQTIMRNLIWYFVFQVEYISAHREDRIAPAFFDRHPEMVRKFEHLIDQCCDTQRGLP